MQRIILVDDEKLLLDLMAEELREQGWVVDPFERPSDALPALQKRSYAIGIFDIMMPGMSGIDLLKKARALQERMDVIFITGYADVETAIDAVQLGAVNYLKRPFENRELVQVVRRTFIRQSLEQRLGAISAFARNIPTSINETLRETLDCMTSTLCPNCVYVTFVELENAEPVWVTHGLESEDIDLKARLPDLKAWLEGAVQGSLNIPDIDEDKTYPLHFESSKSLLFAPIIHDGTLIGAILCKACQLNAFSPADEDFIVAMAHFVSRAVEQVINAEKDRRAMEKELEFEFLRAIAGGVAHDIKNPLAIITGRAQRTMKTVETSGPVYDALKVITDQAISADERMNELLDFCFHTDLSAREKVRINRIVKETELALRNTGLPNGVELISQLTESTASVNGNSRQLKRALRNVMMNAIRATGGTGRVKVTTSIVNGTAQIRVFNTGEPIPKSHWEEIFRPQVTDKNRSGYYQRSGYGLPITLGILESLRGNVEVESSEPEHGTTFLLTIPLAEKGEEG